MDHLFPWFLACKMFLLYLICFSLLGYSSFLLWLSSKPFCCCFHKSGGLFLFSLPCPTRNPDSSAISALGFAITLSQCSMITPRVGTSDSELLAVTFSVCKFEFSLPPAGLHVSDPSLPWPTQTSLTHFPPCRLREILSLSAASLLLILFHHWILLILLLGFLGNWSLSIPVGLFVIWAIKMPPPHKPLCDLNSIYHVVITSS